MNFLHNLFYGLGVYIRQFIDFLGGAKQYSPAEITPVRNFAPPKPGLTNRVQSSGRRAFFTRAFTHYRRMVRSA